MNFSEVVKKRRAYRSLLPFEVKEEMIRELAELASLAPSCFNKQPWRFIFIYEKENLEKIFSTLSDANAWAKNASMVIAVFSKPDLDCIVKGKEYYLFDTGMATANIIIRLTEMGLVAHPIAGFNEEKAKKVLNIPQEYRIITLIITGKHNENYADVLTEKAAISEKTRPSRKNFREVAFLNTF